MNNCVNRFRARINKSNYRKSPFVIKSNLLCFRNCVTFYQNKVIANYVTHRYAFPINGVKTNPSSCFFFISPYDTFDIVWVLLKLRDKFASCSIVCSSHRFPFVLFIIEITIIADITNFIVFLKHYFEVRNKLFVRGKFMWLSNGKVLFWKQDIIPLISFDGHFAMGIKPSVFSKLNYCGTCDSTRTARFAKAIPGSY